ncbi:MAG: TetR/AcrR family transcriptional regulator [Pirellulaceae bacterium]|nr:TetR/AcrR family transcriptional regulator [Pirellulaceae bacterium]
MKGTDTRARIFRAAIQLAARDGLLTLTLENVATESGLSKGGVMHHFATKEALLSGVIMHFTDQVEREMTRLVAEDPQPSFRWVRAMLRLMDQDTSATAEGLPMKQTLDRFMLSVLAATVNNPELMKPVQAIGQRLRGRLTSVPEEGLEQLVMWLVMDGLFLWQFVGMLADDDPLITQVHAHLLEKINARGGPPSPPAKTPKLRRSTNNARRSRRKPPRKGTSP